MSPQIVVKAGQIVQDVRSGMTGSELMDKYSLSPRGLRTVLRTIATVKQMTPTDFYGRNSVGGPTSDVTMIRMDPRKEIFVPVRVYDSRDPEARGFLNDLNEKGLGVRGMPTDVGHRRSLVIRADEVFTMDPFVFDAKCRWTRADKGEDGHLSGFEIDYISDTHRETLRLFLETLDYMFRPG